MAVSSFILPTIEGLAPDLHWRIVRLFKAAATLIQ
jgi:hypothetical protein